MFSKITLIPAIDVIEGQVVRLKQGDVNQKTGYRQSPIEYAKMFLELGFSTIQFIDILAAKTGWFSCLNILEKIARIGLKIHYGGGIRSLEEMKACLDAGVQRVISSTAALQDRKLLGQMVATFGAEQIILALDVKCHKAFIHGWDSYLNHDVSTILDFAKAEGIQHILMTDISRDGMQRGVNASFYGKLTAKHPALNIIAAGGISHLDDIRQLKLCNINQMVVGKAFYENTSFVNAFKTRVSL